MSTPGPARAVLVRRLPFPAGRVFDAWLDPALLGRWMFGPAVRDETVERLEVDARVGGRFSFVVRRQGVEFDHVGEYREIERPRRLAFTWGLRADLPATSLVLVEISPAPGGCELRLTHEMDARWADFTDKAAASWARMVSALEAALAAPPSPRSAQTANPFPMNKNPSAENQSLASFPAPGEVRLVRLLPGPIERVWDFILDPEKRARWFCGGVWEQKVGGKAVFAMHHKNLAPGETPPPEYAKVQDPGVTFEGRVLRCEPPRLLEFTFGGDDSVVTFDLAPEGDRVRLVLTHRASGDDLKDVGSFASGWHIHFGLLIALLENTPRSPFWSEHLRLKAIYCRMSGTSPEGGCISSRS